EAIRAETCLFLETARTRNGDTFKPTSSKVSDVIDALKALCQLDGLIDPPAWLLKANDLPSATEFLACANGLLHFPTGRLQSATPHFFNLAATDVTYDPSAPPPTLWLEFLRELWDDDEQSKQTLQELFGYALTPDTSQHKMGLIVGPPRAGKG